MYGINGFDDNEYLQQLLAKNAPDLNQQESFHAQELPQIQQGLLGNTGAQNQPEMPHGGQEVAAQLAQLAQAPVSAGDGGLTQGRAQTSQAAQQALAQNQQQNMQSIQTLATLAKLFL